MKTSLNKKAPRNIRAERTLRRIRRDRVRGRRETYLHNLRRGGVRRRNIRPIQDVPVEIIVLSSDDEENQPEEVNQDPPPGDERSGSDCILLDSFPSGEDAQEAVPNPPGAIPTPFRPSMTREQLINLFQESSSSEDDEQICIPSMFTRRDQISDSPAPGELWPASAAWSSRYHSRKMSSFKPK